MAAQRHRACRRAWVQGVEDLVGVHHMGYLDNLRIVSRPLLSRSSSLLHCIAFSLSRISHHLALHPPHPPQASISRAYPTRYTRIRIHAQCSDHCSHFSLADTPSLVLHLHDGHEFSSLTLLTHVLLFLGSRSQRYHCPHRYLIQTPIRLYQQPRTMLQHTSSPLPVDNLDVY